MNWHVYTVKKNSSLDYLLWLGERVGGLDVNKADLSRGRGGWVGVGRRLFSHLPFAKKYCPPETLGLEKGAICHF